MSLKRYKCIIRPFLIAVALILWHAEIMKGQDIIVKNNGDELNAKVEEIQDSVIKYRNFDNLAGPQYVLNKSEIFEIKYANGSRDVFGNTLQGSKEAAITSSGQTVPAVIYFYRPSKFVGSAPDITVGTYIPDEVIVHIRNGRWHRSEYNHTGQRDLVTGVYSVNDRKLAVNFEPGKTYYIRCTIMPGMGIQSQVELVDEATAKKEMKGLKEQVQAIEK
jgi:hypothetical protein